MVSDKASPYRAILRVVTCIVVGTSGPGAPKAAGDPAALLHALWVEPTDLATRDLFFGPGGREQAPQVDAEYRILSMDKTGHSDSYDVVGPDGRRWKVKVGDEVHSEIVVSRILWAIGYHQPATYFVDRWRATGRSGIKPEPARFRLNSGHESHGQWAFRDVPFVGTRALRGLIVVNLLLNNWDFADAGNNRLYDVSDGKGGTTRWYVMQDVGNSLGRSRFPIGTRSRIEDFESQGFVREARDGQVVFDYHGRHKRLLADIAPADVAWACGLLARLSPRQWSDAFRGAGYADDIRDRYLRKIDEKIREGVALDARTGTERRLRSRTTSLP